MLGVGAVVGEIDLELSCVSVVAVNVISDEFTGGGRIIKLLKWAVTILPFSMLSISNVTGLRTREILYRTIHLGNSFLDFETGPCYVKERARQHEL